MSFESLAEHLTLVACILLAFTFIGLPVRVALGALGREAPTVPTPLLGTGVLVVTGWYWYGPFGGLRPMVYLLIGIGVITASGLAIHHRHTWRRSLQDLVRGLTLPAMVAVGVAVVLTLSWGSILASPYPTNVTDGNNDISSYALMGQHVADQGPDEPGPIAGFSAGTRSQTNFDFGAVAIVAAASSSGPFGDVWRYQHPLMAVALGLIAYVLARLLDELAPGHTVLAALAGVASICPILVTYIWSNYFLNAVLAISLVVAACVAIMRGASSPVRARITHGLAAAMVLASLFASYPHMAFAGPLVIVPALFAAHGFTRLWPRLIAVTIQGGGALIAAFLLLPGPALRIPDNLRYLNDIEAGWALPGFLPTEILGFARTVAPVHSGLAQWVPSILVLGGLAAMSLWAIWRDRARPLGSFVMIVFTLALVSYWYAYESRGGPSYRQWKWITFFTPLLVAAAVMLTAIVLLSFLGRYTRHAQHIAVAAGLAYCLIGVSNSGPVSFGLGRQLSSAQRVTIDLSSLEGNPVMRDIEEVNVDLPAFWETMWAAYFLRDHDVLRLVNPSYYAMADPAPGWTLQRRDAPVPADAKEVRFVNETYELVRR